MWSTPTRFFAGARSIVKEDWVKVGPVWLSPEQVAFRQTSHDWILPSHGKPDYDILRVGPNGHPAGLSGLIIIIKTFWKVLEAEGAY